ncbi:unnamed protein product, partial [Meganyctiphanes norvegica]
DDAQPIAKSISYISQNHYPDDDDNVQSINLGAKPKRPMQIQKSSNALTMENSSIKFDGGNFHQGVRVKQSHLLERSSTSQCNSQMSTVRLANPTIEDLKGSRSPLLSPGASPQVGRRDEVIPPPPVPPRKASPAPSPPSTPGTVHRSIHGSGDVEVEESLELPTAYPRSHTGSSLSTPATTPTTTPVTTPTSPPRTMTLLTQDPPILSPEPAQANMVIKRHRPLSVPHITPRSNVPRSIRVSGSNPSLSSSTPCCHSSCAPSAPPLPISPLPSTSPSAPLAPSPFPSSSSVGESFPALDSGSEEQHGEEDVTPMSPGPPTTTAPSIPLPVTITYTEVIPPEDEPSSPPSYGTASVTPRPRTILPASSPNSLAPPTPPNTTPSPVSPCSTTSVSSSSSSSTCSSSSSSLGGVGFDPDRRRHSATNHHHIDLDDINEEHPYENTNLPPAACVSSARKSATDSDIPLQISALPMSHSTHSQPLITKSLSADRSVGMSDMDCDDSHKEYENLHMDLLSKLTHEGFAQDAVIRALVITRNDISMARDILREFSSKKS